MVSGKYFFPNAPLLCLKRMPAWAVTSVNSMGPEGRAGVAIESGAGGVTGAEAGPTAENSLPVAAKRVFLRIRSLLLAASQHQEGKQR